MEDVVGKGQSTQGEIGFLIQFILGFRAPDMERHLCALHTWSFLLLQEITVCIDELLKRVSPQCNSMCVFCKT